MMAIPLIPADIGKLGKILGMLGSDHDGERAAAGAMATQFLRQRGLDWSDFVASIAPSTGASASSLSHNQQASLCLAVDGWSGKERSFLWSMAASRKTPTDKQREWLADLVRRAEMRRAAA